MCNKLPYCNPRIDKCLMPRIKFLNKLTGFRTLASCCGHEIYKTTIVVKDKKKGEIFEYYSGIILGSRKRNRYYKRDKKGNYFIPEVITHS